MLSLTVRCRGLHGLVECVHGLFEVWDEEQSLTPPLDDDALQRARLAVHEWLANLIQHADFAGRVPEIAVSVERTDGSVHYVIEDNSLGFDLEAVTSAAAARLTALPDRGFGLQLLKACTEDLRYAPADDDRYRLSFTINPLQQPLLNVLLFPGGSSDGPPCA